MKNESELVDLLKGMLGEAILIGTELSKNDYLNGIDDEGAGPLVNKIDRLFLLIKNFINENGMDGVSAKDVLPLFNEIQTLTNNKETK
ncbi:MAG: hypothetical protein C9356_20030 [Oleiphilus sp.]|nr:MAG: hypothetical protein C9356_20030 [Oleiphilus sp.]